MRGRLRYLLQIGALAFAYVVVARLGLMIDAVAGFATLVWPASGLSLAVLWCGGNRLWPGVALGALLTNVWTGAPLLVALGIALGNTLEAWVGASVLRRWPGFRGSLERMRDVFGLTLVGVFCTIISATIGVASLVAGGIVPLLGFALPWRAWWMGDLLGDLVFAPLLLVWADRPPAALQSTRRGESTALAAGILIAGLLVYGRPAQPVILGQAYLLFPFLIWAALRFGQRGAVTATFAGSVMAIAGTAMGYGPFVRPSLHQSLLVLQTFMAVTGSTFLVLGASILETRKAVGDLRAAHQGLETKIEQRTAALSKANERLELLQQLEEAVGARDELISIASHELRTPLAALQLQLHLITRSLQRSPADGVEPSQLLLKLGVIDRQVMRLAKLIEHLLDVSRITAGRLELELEEVDLAAVVRDVVARFEPELERSKCTLKLRADVASIGRWDRMRVDQIVTNLLSNALKYGGGKPIAVTVEGNDTTGRLVVEDHGIGIAAENQTRIFERFERVRSRDGHGFGLGLWIVRRIVEAMKGTIVVTSELGAGSTFVVELPRRILESGERASRPEQDPSRGEASSTSRGESD